jgi:uncharacterized protein YcaQ
MFLLTIYPLKTLRTLAIYSQNLHLPQGSEPVPDAQSLLALIERLGCIQIDTLQRVHRSQYLAIWSRFGTYSPGLLDTLAYGGVDENGNPIGRLLFEFWFHAACFLPLSAYRFRRQRMQRMAAGGGSYTRAWLAKPGTAELLDGVYNRVREEGPLRARDFDHQGRRRGAWWDWKPAKRALEHLFNRGDLMIAGRENFQRKYDLTERVLPDWVDQDHPTERETARYVLGTAARALGVCDLRQIADYSHDYLRGEARPHLEEMLAEGILVPIHGRLDGGRVADLVVHRDNLRTLEQIQSGGIDAQRTTLLSPFDTFFYPQGRDEMLWGFRQVLEAYKPAHQREWGYFCLPILDRERLIGRLDPRLDRKSGRLHIEGLYLEPGVRPSKRLGRSLARALREFMRFHQARDLTIERSRPREFAADVEREL